MEPGASWYTVGEVSMSTAFTAEKINMCQDNCDGMLFSQFCRYESTFRWVKWARQQETLRDLTLVKV
jgi:hypothetical protein